MNLMNPALLFAASLLIGATHGLRAADEAGSSSVAPLDQLNGTVIPGLVIMDGGRVTFGRADMKAERVDTNTLAYKGTPYIGGSSHALRFILRYDPKVKIFGFSIEGEWGPVFADLPVTYAEGTGFTGRGVVKLKDKTTDWDGELKVVKNDKGKWDGKLVLSEKDPGRGHFEYNFSVDRAGP